MTYDPNYPGGYRHAMHQHEHEAWSASHYPGTRQLCVDCDEPTGHCEDDTIRAGDHGPLCEDCRDARKCLTCEASGEIFVRRNSRGQIDYIDGSPTSETTPCESCNGTGFRQ